MGAVNSICTSTPKWNQSKYNSGINYACAQVGRKHIIHTLSKDNSNFDALLEKFISYIHEMLTLEDPVKVTKKNYFCYYEHSTPQNLWPQEEEKVGNCRRQYFK